MQWFKHYNTASEGLSIQGLLAQGDHEAVACYWILLELVSRFEKENRRGHIEIPLSLLAAKWAVTCPKAERILNRLCLNMCSTLDHDLNVIQPKVASITVHNWLELQETRGGKKNQKLCKEPGDLRLKNKEYIPPPKSAGSLQGLTECIAEHQSSLKHFGITRSPVLADESRIGAALQRFGFETVRAALVGARKEPGNEKFDPAKHYALNRILDPRSIERFANLGSQNSNIDTEAM